MKTFTMKSAIFSLCLFLGGSLAGAQTTVTVGPSGQYASPCAAFSHLADGDTVEIDANNEIPYTDTSDCNINNNDLTIVGVNGRPILDATNAGIAKGIWVENGHDNVINNFEFRNAHNSNNAAGIRIQNGYVAGGGSPDGGDVTIEHCYIHDNDMGILSSGADAGDVWYSSSPFITMQYDEFSRAGAGNPGYDHNIYMGYGGNLTYTLEYSWSHDNPYTGEEVKTREPINNIYYNLINDNLLYNAADDPSGNSNGGFTIEMPAGGSTYIVGNVIAKGPSCVNCNSADIMWRTQQADDEGAVYGVPNDDLHFVNNTVYDDPSNGFPPQYITTNCYNAAESTCSANPPSAGPNLVTPPVIENNIFIGPAASGSTPINPINQDVSPTPVEENNINLVNTTANLASLKFSDPLALDFRLLAGSPAIGEGIYPPTNSNGVADPLALAVDEYSYTSNIVARPTPTGATMDAGAYAYAPIATPTVTLSYTETVQAPNSGTITISGLPTPPSGQYNTVSFESQNQFVIPNPITVTGSATTLTTTFTVYTVAATTVVPVNVYVDGGILTASITVNPGAAALQSITLDSVYDASTTVHLLGPGTSPVVVDLTSSNPSILYIPATVTIPAGELSAETGSLNGGLNPPAISPSAPVTVTATYDSKSVTLTTPIDSTGLHNVYCSTCTEPAGTPIGFAVILAGAGIEGGSVVQMVSSNTAVIPNESVTVPAGQCCANINLPTNAVTASTNVTVTAEYNGQDYGNAVTVTPASGVAVSATSGSGQSSAVGTNFASPLVVTVTNGGSPVSGTTVTFSGSGVSFPSGATAVTNSSGVASVTAQPTATGSLVITASASGANATFSETGTAAPAASIAVVSGSGQSSAVGTAFASPLVAVVKNSSGTGVSGVTVTFAGTGVSFPTGATAVTNSSGDASVTAEPTSAGSLTVTASVSGVGTPASFSETGTSAVALSSITLDNSYQSGTTVHLTAAAPAGGAVVDLSSSNQSIEYIPATVTVPAGSTSAETGSLLGSLWGQTPATQPATVTASYGGVQKTLAITVYTTEVHDFGQCSCVVVGGSPIGLVLETAFNVAPVGGAPYTVTSSNTAVIPNQSFTLPAGSGYQGISLTTNAVTATTTVTVTLNYNGIQWGVPITVNPGPNAPASIAVVSGSGQSSAVGTAFTSPLVAVVKNSSGTGVSGVTVTFAGTGVSFPTGATAVTNSSGDASVTAEPTSAGSLTVTASVSGVGTPASFSETGTSAVALSSITLDNSYQSGTTVHLTAAAPAGGAVVDLSSSNQSIEYIPATVTVPAGSTSAETGSLLGSLWGQSPTSEAATVTASYGGVQKTLAISVFYTTIHSVNCGSSVTGGQSVNCGLESAFNVAPVGGAPFTVTSSNTAVIPNASFTLAAGQGNDFNINLPTNAVSTATTVTLTLNYNGAEWGNTVVVNP